MSSLSMHSHRNIATPTTSVWTSGRFALRVYGASGYERPVEVRRPFALIGRGPGCDVVLDDHAISPAHVYLHLDRRGLFAVDLATRAGSRIGPSQEPYAWLRPGEFIEIAGYDVELAALHIDDQENTETLDADPLFDIADGPDVALYPDGGALPRLLRSQLIFAGRSEACGIQVDDPHAAPVQCVIARSPQGVHVVDLVGRVTQINGHPIRNPAPLRDGDVLAIGAARFECRIKGALSVVSDALPGVSDDPTASPNPTTLKTQQSLLSTQRLALQPRTTDNGRRTLSKPSGENQDSVHSPLATHHSPLPTLSQLALDRLASEDQDSVLAWMLGALQTTHDELLRRQAEFQNDVLRALRKLHKQQTTVHSMQLERLEYLNHEVALLRDEVRRRYGANAPAPRTELPRALPAIPPLPPRGNIVDETNAWLSRRIHHINQETRAARRAAIKK